MGPGGVNSGFGKPAYPGGPINNDWSDPSDPRLNQPPSNKPMPVGLPSTGLPSRLPGGLPNDGVAQPYQPQPITRDGRTYMPGPRPTTGDFAPDNTLDRHTAEALPHYAFGTGIGGFNPMKMIQKVIGGLPAAGQAPAQQAVNGLPSMTPTPTMPVSPGSPAVTPIAQPPATPPATGGAGAGSTPAGTPPAGAAPTSTLTRRAERMARHAAGAAPPPPVSPANPPPSPQPVTSTQDGPLVSPVGGGQGPLPGMTPPSQETLDMIRKLREGTIVPNLNPYDVNWNQIDPAVKAAYYQAMQSKFGVPIEAQQWEQQKYALAGIDGRSSGY